MTEIQSTEGRTWFLTLTLRPEEQFRMTSLARLRLAKAGEDFDGLPPARQFAERHREVGREITRYLKRVRKEAGEGVRYFIVAERHKSGLPHYHALVHEADADHPIRASTLKRQWRMGFSNAKLVAQDESHKGAAYVSKYLSKDALARVRASVGYGHSERSRHPLGIATNQLRETLPDPIIRTDLTDGSADILTDKETNFADCDSTRIPGASACPS